ncbi:MAG: FtsX-like permease family protein [Gemmatimonadota bacterium]
MKPLPFVVAMAWREGRAARRRLLLLTAAIAVGVAALVAINSFTDNLSRSVDDQAKALLGADLVVNSPSAPTGQLLTLIDSIAKAPGRARAAVTSFSAMAYVTRTSGVRLVEVAAVEPGYPFYGDVKTAPAGAWAALQNSPGTLVDAGVLTALDAHIGDTLAVGEARFVIAGTVDNFPGDGSIRSAFGPRIFISARYLAATGLLTFGSRAQYKTFIKLAPDEKTEPVAKQFRKPISAERGRIRTVEEDQERLKSFLDQLGRYLGLIALVALLLGGLAVASAVQVFIRQKRESIAVLRCLGASTRQLFSVYLLQAGAMGLLGSILGAVLGALIQLGLPRVLSGLLPLDVSVQLSWGAIAQGIGVGVWVALAFALLPLLAIRKVAPLVVLRRPFEEGAKSRPDRWVVLAALVLALSVAGLAALQVRNLVRGAIFAGAAGVALLVLWLAALGLVRALKRWFPHSLQYVYRQGLANLYRPANQTVLVVLSLGFGGFLLTTVALMQQNLLSSFNIDRAPDRPNLVLFDIQPDQLAGLDSLLDADKIVHRGAVPIIPMRISALKGKPVSLLLGDTTAREGGDGDRPGRWALRREFRSTYRDTVVASEKVLTGKWWDQLKQDRFASRGLGFTATDTVPISMEVGVAGELGVTIGDAITWDVQGLPIITRITSLRTVDWARFEPNFFIVFPNGPLDKAPQMLVALARVPDAAALGLLQRRVAERWPNITSIDQSLVQRTIEAVVDRVVLAIRFMALFSLATGAIVLVGAVAASRLQRLREAVLLRTLGATGSQVARILAVEYASLGVLSAVVALGLALAAGWALMKWVFEVPFVLPAASLALLPAGLIVLTVSVGLWSSRDVWRRAPLEVLREE